MSESILVIVAHPDDEVLGCGGTIAKKTGRGETVNVVFLADGVFSRDNADSHGLDLDTRRKAACTACDILGVNSVHFGEFPDNRMDSISLLDIVKAVEAQLIQHHPDMVLTHHLGDLNIDHRRVHEAVVTACRPQKDNTVKRLLSFEVPSSTEWQTPTAAGCFSPNWFEDISLSLDVKLRALEAYASEVCRWPHPRSRSGVEHLARWRGATGGFEAAEAFMLVRALL